MNNEVKMEQTNKLIPELRFPEFVHDGEWKITELSKLTDIYKGEQLNRIELTDNGKYPCQNGGVNASGYTDKYNCEENTITISEGGNSCGYVNFMSTKFWLGGHCYKLVLKNGINNYFLYQVLKFNEENIMRLRVGSGLPNIQMKSLREFEISITESFKEQQKIADCLSSLDEAITAHIDKLEALKNHKKGLLQNLFPQDGQKVPNYRFPEFVNDVKWEEKKLNVFLELLTDFEANGSFADVKSNVSIYDDRNYAWYVRSTDLENKSSLETVKYVDETSYKFLKKTVLKGGELLITKRGEIGKVYIYESIENLPATLAPNLYLLKLNDKAKPIFFYYYFINNIGKQSLKRLNASSTIGALYKDDVKNINVVAPNLKEQKKIADCLREVDNLITAQTEKIEKLKAHKKGLMQGLFPKID